MSGKRLPTITIELQPKLWDYLRQLVDSGLFGHSRADAAERLLCEGIEKRLLVPSDRALLRDWMNSRDVERVRLKALKSVRTPKRTLRRQRASEEGSRG